MAVEKADKDNLFYLFSTNLRAERFMKGMLKVYSPARFEVFVNGESKQTKTTAEDSLSQVRPTAVSLSLIHIYYPLARSIYVLLNDPRSALPWGFASFLASDRGQRIILKSGLVPATQPVRVVNVKDE